MFHARLTTASTANVSFRTTRWTLVTSAQSRDLPEAKAALSELCEVYWYPLYAFLRARGTAEDDALDLVQGFFARLIERQDLAAEPERGRFRSYMLGALRHHVSNVARHDSAAARGGGQPTFSLDFSDAEGRYSREPAHSLTPERLYERRWAMIVLDRALQRLAHEYEERGRQRIFEGLKPFIAGRENGATLVSTAADLGISESAAKVAIYRLRQRMRELLRDEIAQTVTTPEDIDAELRALFSALSS